jgi:hypothetical protein
MKQRMIDITVETTASADAVFDLVEHGATWPEWTSIETVEIERPPEGIGAIRVNRRGRVVGRDEIIEVARPQRFVYRSLSGLPVRDYVGEIDIASTPAGASIRWRASFFPKVPGMGGMLERGVRKFLTDCAEGLARHAAEVAQRLS